MEFFIILILIIFNGIFSMAEIAIVSSRKSKLKHMIAEGNTSAQAAYKLLEKPSFFFSTVQIGITAIGILTGAIGDGQIVGKLSTVLQSWPLIGIFHNEIAFFVVIVSITYLTVIIGELVPKRIALNNPEKIASFLAPFMSVISHIAFPLVNFLSRSTELVFKLLRIGPSHELPITEDEIRALIRQGTDIGIFNKTEKKLVEQALQLDDLKVSALMMPRNKIKFFDIAHISHNPRKYLKNYRHSRVIFARGVIDKIEGVVHVKDLLQTYLDDSFDIKKILMKPLFVPEYTRALKLLELFRHSPTHIAIVLDEFGNVQGLITLNDIFESLVGNIKTQSSYDDKNIIKNKDGSIFLDGMLPIGEVKKLLRIDTLPKEETGSYHTLGGFVISYLDKIPRSGTKFTWKHYDFEIIDMDDNRVDKVLIKENKTKI
ncbi:MAG: hemolysin family protein [Candidatus Roizmanbacteria bacterium]|nr:hemolysin family protein [Candidatus Roizmanbacteria bacterium]